MSSNGKLKYVYKSGLSSDAHFGTATKHFIYACRAISSNLDSPWLAALNKSSSPRLHWRLNSLRHQSHKLLFSRRSISRNLNQRPYAFSTCQAYPEFSLRPGPPSELEPPPNTTTRSRWTSDSRKPVFITTLQLSGREKAIGFRGLNRRCGPFEGSRDRLLSGSYGKSARAFQVGTPWVGNRSSRSINV